METWNREELYKEVWAQPMTKLVPKYGISAVALGKVCDSHLSRLAGIFYQAVVPNSRRKTPAPYAGALRVQRFQHRCRPQTRA
jgi:hypothetical protein